MSSPKARHLARTTWRDTPKFKPRLRTVLVKWASQPFEVVKDIRDGIDEQRRDGDQKP